MQSTTFQLSSSCQYIHLTWEFQASFNLLYYALHFRHFVDYILIYILMLHCIFEFKLSRTSTGNSRFTILTKMLQILVNGHFKLILESHIIYFLIYSAQWHIIILRSFTIIPTKGHVSFLIHRSQSFKTRGNQRSLTKY